MKILCFGDSNTYGVNPSTGKRLSKPWPKLLAEANNDLEVISNGLLYRTFVASIPKRPNRGGLVAFESEIAKPESLDYAFVMLASNDLRSELGLSGGDIFAHAKQYVDAISSAGLEQKTELVYIIPAYFGDDIERVRPGQLPDAKARLNDFHSQVSQAGYSHVDCRDLQCGEDQIHLTQKSHKMVAERVGKYIKERLK